MTEVSKKLDKEETRSTPSKRLLEENTPFASFSEKLVQSVADESLSPFEYRIDGRSAKIQRAEIHDFESRPSPKQHISSFTNKFNPITSDSKLVLGSIKDVRDMVSGSKETKQETRHFYPNMSSNSKNLNETRLDFMGVEKELGFDRTAHSDFKGDNKFEKDNYTHANNLINLTGSKEFNMVRRFSRSSSKHPDSWHPAGNVINHSEEVGKDLLMADDSESFKGPEVVNNRKLNLKCEEKVREREKEKYKSDHRNKLHVISSGEKSQVREESEVNLWKREIVKIQTVGEGIEKNLIKKERLHVGGMACLQDEKQADEHEKIEEQELLYFEPMGPNDSIKHFDSDCWEKDQENNAKVDAAMNEKCDSFHDKEADDGFDADRVIEKVRESIDHGFQMHKRMPHSRGTSPMVNMESQSHSGQSNHEGSQGKLEVSMIVYKPGVSIMELLKSWDEIASLDDKVVTFGPVFQVQIAPHYISLTNRQLKYAQMWGTDVYTIDSDLVAVLIHTGYCRPTSLTFPDSVDEIQATIRVLPPQDCYLSTCRNNIHSRAWGSSAHCSYSVQSCCIIKKGGETFNLEPRYNHISGLEPTVAPLSFERMMITRAAASNPLRQHRFVREVSIQYNLCNEPWMKYSLSMVADKGMRKSHYTSARLKRGEVLFLETHFTRYELCFIGEKADCNFTSTSNQNSPFKEKYQNQNSHAQACDRTAKHRENIVDVFRWSRCKKALPQKFMRSVGIPLPTEHLEVLEENLEWEDIQWSRTGVWIVGNEYELARVHFMPPKMSSLSITVLAASFSWYNLSISLGIIF